MTDWLISLKRKELIHHSGKSNHEPINRRPCQSGWRVECAQHHYLPNNKNIFDGGLNSAAEVIDQICSMLAPRIIPRDWSGLCSFDESKQNRSKNKNYERMSASIAMLRLVVTTAARDTTIDGFEIHENDKPWMVVMAKSLFQIQIWWKPGRNIRSYVGRTLKWGCNYPCRWRRQWRVGKWIGPSFLLRSMRM